MARDRAGGRTWRAAGLVVAAAVAAALVAGCSTVADLAGGAPPVRSSAGLSGPTGKESFYGTVEGHFGIAMTWLTMPDDSLYVSVFFTPVDRFGPFRHEGGQQVFTADGAGPGTEVTLTGVPSVHGEPPPPPPATARFSADGRSVLLSVPGHAPVTLTRMSSARFEALMMRARYPAPRPTPSGPARPTGSR